jgi:hypothetical protein
LANFTFWSSGTASLKRYWRFSIAARDLVMFFPALRLICFFLISHRAGLFSVAVVFAIFKLFSAAGASVAPSSAAVQFSIFGNLGSFGNPFQIQSCPHFRYLLR